MTAGPDYATRTRARPLFAIIALLVALTSGCATHTEPEAVKPATVDPSKDAWLKPFVGVWSGHGRIIKIAADGHGTSAERTYLNCKRPEDKEQDIPCEDPYGEYAVRAEFLLVQKNNQVYAHITKSTWDKLRGDVPMTFQEIGVLRYNDTPYCNANVVSEETNYEICGM